jgi:hypothetical protein
MGRQHSLSDTGHPQAREGERVDSGPLGRRAEVDSRKFVREVRANLLAGVMPSEAASGSRRWHRRNIDALPDRRPPEVNALDQAGDLLPSLLCKPVAMMSARPTAIGDGRAREGPVWTPNWGATDTS